jgi:hypothetical protein
MAKRKYCEDHYERLTELALEVHQFWKNGVDVSYSAIHRSKKYNKFCSAAGNVGISWQEVLVAAGISIDEVIKQRSWSEDHYDRLTELALEVHQLWKSGVKFPVGGFLKDQRYKRLNSAASRKGISWSEVLVAAHIPIDEVIRTVRMRTWSKEHYECLTELALEVHQLWKNGVDVSSSAIHKSEKYMRFISAAENAGITWQEVLIAAGIPLDKFFKIRKWSTGHYERLTEIALELHKIWKSGVDVSSSAIKKSKKYNKLYYATNLSSIESGQKIIMIVLASLLLRYINFGRVVVKFHLGPYDITIIIKDYLEPHIIKVFPGRRY